MRPALTAILVTLLLTACGGAGPEPLPPATTDPSRPTTSPAATPPPNDAAPSAGEPTTSPTVPAEPAVLPPGVPTTYDRDVEPGDLPPEQLVPDGAGVDDTAFPSEDTAIFTWSVGEDPFRSEHGLVVWRRTAGGRPPWRATYGVREPARAGVLGLRIETGDATGDRQDDALVFASVGGSGTCGTWRLIALTPAGDAATFERDLCDATVEIAAEPAGLRLTEAVFAAGDPHCCPSGVTTSTLEWNGRRWRVTSIDRSTG